jgi:hypothetical protein
MAQEQRCNVVEGKNSSKCVALRKQIDECYESCLCPERYAVKIECLATQKAEDCQFVEEKSRECREKFFKSIVANVKVREYVHKMITVQDECEEQRKQVENAVKLNKNNSEAVDAEFKLISCIWSKMLAPTLWSKFQSCAEKNPFNIAESCRFYIEKIETEMKIESDAVVKAMGFQYGDFMRWNGATSILDNLVSPVLCSAHLENIIREYNTNEEAQNKHRPTS